MISAERTEHRLQGYAVKKATGDLTRRDHVVTLLTLDNEGVKPMEGDPGYTPLAHEEECDCCCGSDRFAEREGYPKDDEGGPIYRPF